MTVIRPRHQHHREPQMRLFTRKDRLIRRISIPACAAVVILGWPGGLTNTRFSPRLAWGSQARPHTAVRGLSTQQAVLERSRCLTQSGHAIHYLRSVFLPGESRCLCLFHAEDAALTKDVNDAAGFTYICILNALDRVLGDAIES